jgi:arylsulfatase A-like enzyme
MKRPNIILIYTDEQRYDTLGVNGNPLIRTPNLDRLGQDGVTFHGAHVTSPVCVPSRVGLFTGRHTHATKSYHNRIHLQPSERDFVSLLSENGYTTALIGKDHCFPRGRDRQIFDYLSRASHTCFLPPKTRREQEINEAHGGGAMWMPYKKHDIPPDEDVSGRLCLEACDYISVHRDGPPFFLWLSFPEPHPPYMAPEPYASMYDDVDVAWPVMREGEMDNKPDRQKLAARASYYDATWPGEEIRNLIRIYWGSCSYIDAYIGKVLQALEDHGIADETIVVFTSDHGDHLGDHHLCHKQVALYDTLTRVPLIFRYPGITPRQSRALVCNLDIMPTILDIAGVPTDRPHHGRSFRAVMEGGEDVHRDALLLDHGYHGAPIREKDLSPAELAELTGPESHPGREEFNSGRSKAIRTDRWKLVVLPGDVDELYDLEADPNELNNLADDPACADAKARLTRRLLDELIVTQDEVTPDEFEAFQDSRWWT